ncbi:MAG: zinc metalloprotease HtpX [Candidatus Aenigmatarchaeota archaeon]
MPANLIITMFLTLFLLFGFLFAILAAIGYYIGLSGYLIVAIAIFLVFIQWLIGPNIIWWTTNMRPLEKNEYPWIWETVEEISKKHKVPMPKKIALVRSGAPNAFVFGRTPRSATLAITQGLLNNLTKEEVKAVIGHEMGHIKHKDMVVMTVVSAIPVIAYFIARFLIFTSDSKRERGAAVLIGLGAFIVYFITNLLVLALSRLREYYADRFGGLATKPKLLANALAKITYGLSLHKEDVNQAARAFFIADPITSNFEISHFSSEYSDLKISGEEVKKAMEWEKKNIYARISEIFRTHPLSFKRIQALLKLEKELTEKK